VPVRRLAAGLYVVRVQTEAGVSLTRRLLIGE